MTHLGLAIITSRSNLDSLAYCVAGVFRKISISKRTDIINNSWALAASGKEVQYAFRKDSYFSAITSDSPVWLDLHPETKKITVSFISTLRAKGLSCVEN